MIQIPVKHYKVMDPPETAEPNSVFFIFGENHAALLVSDSAGNVKPVVVDEAVLEALINAAAASKAPIVQSINAQTGTAYTLQASDNGKIITFSSASPVLVKVPTGLGNGFNCQLFQIGTGQVTVAGTGTTIHNRQSHNKLAGQYSKATLESYSANTFVLSGETRKVNLMLDLITAAPKAAYSFRKLRDAYLGYCAKVRPAGSTEWTDIGFDANDWIDEAAAAAVGSNLEVLLYDQSGNNRNETQSGASSLPRLEFNSFNGKAARKIENSIVSLGDLSAFAAGEVHRLFRLAEDPPIAPLQGLWWQMSGVAHANHFPYVDGVIYDGFGSTTRKILGNPALSLAAWRLYSVYSAPNDWQAFLNSNSLYSTTDNAVSFSANSYLISDRLMWDNDFLIFDQKISNFDRQVIWDNTEEFYNLTF